MTEQLNQAYTPELPFCTVDRPMRIGALDVGAVAAQLLIVQLLPGRPPLRCGKFKEQTRLAPVCRPDGTLAPAGLAVLTGAIGRCLAAARDGGVEQLYLYATSVIRDAPNAGEAVEAVRRECGVRLGFLSGADEARLTYGAARRWAGPRHRLLVLDIGGGTTEIAVGSDAEPDLALSLPLGARRLTATFLPGDPPTADQLAALRRHVRRVVREAGGAVLANGPAGRALATSRIFRQLSRLAGTRHTLAASDLAHWVERLARLPVARRVELPGVTRPRAGQILAGAVIADELLSALAVPSVESCPWALREGIILHHVRDSGTLPLPAIPFPRN